MMDFSAVAVIVVALLAAAWIYRILSQATPSGPDPVSRLWRTALEPKRASAYHDSVAEVNSAFTMFSVALNEALASREEEPALAGSLIEMSLELLGRFLNALEALAKVMTNGSRGLDRWPQVRPLAAANFRSASAVALARRQTLLHTILLSSRMRFLQKLGDIGRAANRLAEEYAEAAQDALLGGASAVAGWQTLDQAHYDLNTLWQETQIVFKAVLHFLPEETVSSLPGQFRVELERREAIPRPVLQVTPSRTR